MIDCRICETTLDIADIIARPCDPACGAVATFVGTARNSSSLGRSSAVSCLEYEAYVPMALREMETIAQECAERFGTIDIVLHHRVGSLAIGDAAVVALAATPHRAEAFAACRYLIEALKERVPIWKREIFIDGGEWVNAHP